MPAPQHGTVPRIVVGVDGSPSSQEALRWAVRQAGLTGGTVDAVMAWEFPSAIGGYGWGPAAMIEEGGFGGVAGAARRQGGRVHGGGVSARDRRLRMGARRNDRGVGLRGDRREDAGR